MTGLNGSEERSHQLACDLSEQAFALTEQLNDDDFTVQALVVRTWMLGDLGHREAARECANAALDLARRINSPRRVAEALAAVVYSYRSPTETREQILDALAIFRQLNDSNWVSTMLQFLSLSLGETQEDVREARALNEEAIELAEEIGSTFHRMILWSNSASFSFFLGEFDLAVQQGRRALRLSRRNGSPAEVDYWTIFTLACCATQEGHFLLGALLTGAHEGFEERAIEPLGGYWSTLEILARENNRGMLRGALGDEEYERAISIGKSMSADRVYDLALGRTGDVA
jgi:tetratricopeptide (TPR) repeat protein